jgi:hypothetical protein
VQFANFGPADYNFEETIGTLRYADRAKRIKNTPKINGEVAGERRTALFRQCYVASSFPL